MIFFIAVTLLIAPAAWSQAGNNMARRDTADPSGLGVYPNWGFSWPANRRVLYAMRQMGLASNRAYRKCAKIVGEVIGNYHPHGDASAYDTLVRLAQDFAMRYVLVDRQGNFGSVDGDPPAAMRYSECRLTPLAMEFWSDRPFRLHDRVRFSRDAVDAAWRKQRLYP